ncbi:MAG: Ca-activated chloride channel family protein, partial [Sediminicola sp.]
LEYEEETYTPKTLLYFYPLGAALGFGFVLVLINNLLLLIKRFINR